MKYSVSYMYSRHSFKHKGKFTDLESVLREYNDGLNKWKTHILNNRYAYAGQDYYGIRIKDESGVIIFEEKHFSEEMGYKKEIEEYEENGQLRYKLKWVKTLDKQK